MLHELLNNHRIILGSGSPRRQQFLKDLGIPFEVRVKPVDEVYPERLYKFEISDYLAQLKSLPLKEALEPKDILITSDTIVWHSEKALGKPRDTKEAHAMLSALSGEMHEVITSVCFTSTSFEKTINSITRVYFNELTSEEITYYIENYHPFDKAGGYGIQDWIGQIAIGNIEGSYCNVVGFPVDKVYQTLKTLLVRE